MTRGYHNPGFKQTITVRMRTQEDLQKIIGNNLTRNLSTLQKSMYNSVREHWRKNRLATHVGKLFEDKMNQYERDHPPKMKTQAPLLFGNLRTDCWRNTYVTMSSEKSDEMNISIVGRNMQQDYLYSIVATKEDEYGMSHNFLISGVIGNLAARRLTRKMGYYTPRYKIAASPIFGDTPGGYLGSKRMADTINGNRTSKLVMYKESGGSIFPIYRDEFKLQGSILYRYAVIGTMRYAVKNSLKLYENPKSHIPKRPDTHIGLRYDYEQNR